MNAPVPVILFAYARPGRLAETLASLRANGVPLILAFADGAKGESDAADVAAARALLRAVDWCEVRLVERVKNMGLGRNILSAVDAVASEFEAFIGWEDDLVGVPGTYAWLCAALAAYRGNARVGSVSGWTHPRVTPTGVGPGVYFDGRAESWSWATWADRWAGMADETALVKQARIVARGVAADAWGCDMSAMAEREEAANLWAVRWMYHHIQYDWLCVRPGRSLVDHRGFDAMASNAAGARVWANARLEPAPEPPAVWPEPRLAVGAAARWQRATQPGAWPRRVGRWLWRRLRAASPDR